MTSFILALIRELIRFLSVVLKTQKPSQKEESVVLIKGEEEESLPKKTFVEELYETEDPDQILEKLIEHEQDPEIKDLLRELSKK